jgi:hypothetical protein
MTDYSQIHLRDDIHQTLCHMRNGFNVLRAQARHRQDSNLGKGARVRDLTIAATVELLLARGRLTLDDVMNYQPVSRTGRPRRDSPDPTWMDAEKTVEAAIAVGRIPGSVTQPTVSEEQLDASAETETDSSEATDSGSERGRAPDNHAG